MKKFIFLSVLLTATAYAFAMSIQSGENVTIVSPVNEDLYIAAGTVTINAPVYGDLIVGGGTVIINDTVANDIMIGGGTVTLNGYVGDDVRAAGGELFIKGVIAGDFVAAGGNIAMSEASVIHGNMLIGGGTVKMEGMVDGTLTSRTGELMFSGVANKDIDCRGGEITMDGVVKGKSTLAATKIMVGNKAEFYRDVQYWSENNPVDFKNAMKYGDALYEPSLEIKSNRWQYLGFASVIGLLWYLLMAYVFILLIQYLFSTTMQKAALHAFTDTLRSVGYGFLFIVGMPIAIFFLAVTIIGIPLSMLALLSYITLILLATIISSVIIANRLQSRPGRNSSTGRISLVALGIFIVLKLLSLIPFIGWLIMLIVTCLAFGSILINVRWRRRKVQLG